MHLSVPTSGKEQNVIEEEEEVLLSASNSQQMLLQDSFLFQQKIPQPFPFLFLNHSPEVGVKNARRSSQV